MGSEYLFVWVCVGGGRGYDMIGEGKGEEVEMLLLRFFEKWSLMGGAFRWARIT